jgi:hypothetical protein
MEGLRVLLTNFSLAARGGAALYVRDVALGLLRKGHRPVVYSTDLGDVAAELRELTVPVVSDLRQLGEGPDVIHGNNNYELMTALLHFPETPAISFCHGWFSWQNEALAFPRVLRYVAVDETCRDRLVYENGVPPDRVKLLLNFVDLDRFKPREPLPSTPRRALVFSNGVAEDNGLEALREACTRAGLDLDVVGLANGSAVARPEELLPRYDLVFGKARCALEGMAAGCAVIVCDVRGLASMVTTENLDHLRRLNFGVRTLSRPLDQGLLYEELGRYSAEDASRVSNAIRGSASLNTAVDELVDVYRAVIGEFASMPGADPAAELKSAAAYLRKISPHAGAADEGSDVLESMPHGWTLAPVCKLPLTGMQASGSAVKHHAKERAAGAAASSRGSRPGGPSSTEAVTISTPGVPWHYAATMSIADLLPNELAGCPGVLRVRLRVHEGVIGVGILNADQTEFLARQGVPAARDYVDVFLRLRRLGEASDFVVQSWDRAAAGRVTIDAVKLYTLNVR